ncbi:hypothetical protein ERJ75_001722300 [Trypanosoma vivax]|nr:hypothetical protein ERJ75_001722300 [Trypanosoma vivax]
MYACVSCSSKGFSLVVVPVSSCPSGPRTPFQSLSPEARRRLITSMLALSSANASRRCVDQTSCLTSFLVLARHSFACFERLVASRPSARREAQLCLPRFCSRPLFSAVSAPCQPRRSNACSSPCPNCFLLRVSWCHRGSLVRHWHAAWWCCPLWSVGAHADATRSTRRFSPLARLSATPLTPASAPLQPCWAVRALTRPLFLLFGVRARSRSRCVSFAIAYCPCLLLHPHGRAQRVPAAPLTCVPQSPRCCPRCAAANVAASLARPARRGAAAATFVSAALLRLASVAPPVEPVAGASLRGRRTGSEAVSGSPRARCAVASGRALLAGCARCLPQLCGRYSALRDQRAACEGNAGARGTASPPSIVIRGRRGRLKVAAKSTGASAARSLFGSRRTAVRASAPTEAVGDGNRKPPRQAGHAREAALRRRLTPATPNAPRTARGSAQLARGNGHCRTPAWPRPGEEGQAVASRAVSTGALCESWHARTRRSSAWSAPGAHSGERAARLGTAAWELQTPARNERGQGHAPR